MSLLIITNGKISDSASTVPISHVDNVTASRDFAAIYTNATGRTMFVVLTVYILVTAINLIARANGLVEFTPGGGLAPAANCGYQETKTPGEGIYGHIIMTVPPGCQYGVGKTETGGTVTLGTWIESY